jgi:hypothetical protein
MISDKGIFTVSLDCELYWGVRDRRTIQQYSNNLLGVRDAIKEILKAFDDYDAHATWAVVGFLFFPNVERLRENVPSELPQYLNPSLSPYRYIMESDTLEAVYHFAPEVIDLICGYDNQEIGTHTFSHYYCLEKGQTADSFHMDLSSAIKVAENRGLTLKSLVFPRNQCNLQFLPILSDLGILCYRGNEDGWAYSAVSREDENTLKRLLRLIDAYVNISGHNTYSIYEVSLQQTFNIPSSRFLGSYSKKLLWLENLRLRRIKEAMSYAAKHKTIFHLWWHPHNFGTNTTENMAFLRAILEHYRMLNRKYNMLSLNMGEIADLIEKNLQTGR